MRCCCYCLSVKQGSYLAAGWSLVSRCVCVCMREREGEEYGKKVGDRDEFGEREMKIELEREMERDIEKMIKRD